MLLGLTHVPISMLCAMEPVAPRFTSTGGPLTKYKQRQRISIETDHNCANNINSIQRSGWCRLAKDLKKYSEKSGGPAKNLEEHSDRKDGYAKNLKHHSKRSVKLAQILRRHPERSIKLAQTLREHSEKNTNCAKNLEEHSGRNELTKHIEQHSKRNAQLANDLEKHLGNAKLTKNFDGSSVWLQRLFAQGVSILHQQKISLECFYETTAEGKSSLVGLQVSSTLRSVEEESRNADENRLVIRQAIKGTLQKMERPGSGLVRGDSEDS
ncbi:hypothetical protein BU17DRAFT_68343 [Hysterangium stoloniferum]|nr:hypothetical protein BU17DRAFT_68343 [Hysterangium stoloniferum]